MRTHNEYRPPLPEYSLTPGDHTLEHWLPHGNRDLIDLNAPYQRAPVWTTEHRRNLIRSICMKLPINPVTVGHLGYESAYRERVIDGKQRILTIRAFFADQFAIPGEWMHAMYLKNPADRGLDIRFSDLSDGGQSLFENSALRSQRFNSRIERTRAADGSWNTRELSPDEAIAAEARLYLLINFGGVEQTDDDFQRAAAVAGERLW